MTYVVISIAALVVFDTLLLYNLVAERSTSRRLDNERYDLKQQLERMREKHASEALHRQLAENRLAEARNFLAVANIELAKHKRPPAKVLPFSPVERGLQVGDAVCNSWGLCGTVEKVGAVTVKVRPFGGGSSSIMALDSVRMAPAIIPVDTKGSDR